MNLKNISIITDALSSTDKYIAYANYLREKFLEDYNNRPAGSELGTGVEFDFIKKDGTHRHAVGTYKPYINTSGVHKTPNPMQFGYYDLEKDAYRSFMADQLVIPADFEFSEYKGVVETPSEETAEASMQFLKNWRMFATKPYGVNKYQFDYLKLHTEGSDLVIEGTNEKVVNEAVDFVIDGFEDGSFETSVEKTE